MIKINIGCGTDYKKDYINIDHSNNIKTDIVCNIEKNLPFNNNIANEILLKHVLEHTHEPIRLIEECHRVLKKNGLLYVYCPHVSQFESIGELDHKRHGIGVFSFHYTTNKHVMKRNYYTTARFSIEKVRIITHPFLQFFSDLSPIKYEHYLSRFFGAREIQFILKKSEGWC